MEPLAQWAVELDASGTRASLEEILAGFRAELEALDTAAKATKLGFDTSALDAANAKIDETRKKLAEPMHAAIAPVSPPPTPGPAPVNLSKTEAEQLKKQYGMTPEQLAAFMAQTKAAPATVTPPAPAPAPAPAPPLAATFQRLAAPAPQAPEAALPAPKIGLASEPIKAAREELLATQRTAEGVGAALRIAKENIADLKFSHDLAEPPDFKPFEDAIAGIQKDFLAGRATAEESLRAIAGTQRAVGAEIADAKRAEAEAFKAAERDKREAAIETEKAMRSQHASLGMAGQIFGTTASTAGSAAAMMIGLRLRTEEAYGATQQQLFGMQQMSDAIPHAVAAFQGVGLMLTGGPLGMLAGGASLITGLVGLITNANRPLPRQDQKREDVAGAYERVQLGALRSDIGAFERMDRHLEAIARHTATMSSRSADRSAVGA